MSPYRTAAPRLPIVTPRPSLQWLAFDVLLALCASVIAVSVALAKGWEWRW